MLEAKDMKVERRKAPAPAHKVTGNSGTLKGVNDSTLERLRDEADKTGDFTHVLAYKRKLKAKT